MISTPLAPAEPLQVPTPAPSRSPSPPKPEPVSTPEPKVIPIDPIPDPKPLPAQPPLEQTSSEISIDPTSKVKSIVRQFDEDPGLAKKKNNFIATAKAKYSYDRRKRTVSNDSDLMPFRGRTDSPSPGPDAMAESRITNQRSISSTESQSTRQPSLFDIATSRIASYEHTRVQNKPAESRIPTMSSSNIKDDRSMQGRVSISEDTREKDKTPAKETKVIPPPEPSPSFKPIDRTIRQPNATPLAVTIPNTASSNSSEYSESATITPNNAISPSIERLQMDSEFIESPILGDVIMTGNFPILDVQSKQSVPVTTLESIPSINSGLLKPIFEETPALTVFKADSTPALNIVKSPQKSQFNDSAPTFPMRAKETPISGVTSPPSSSSSSKLAEQTSSYEDFGGISMDDHDLQDDARSDTSVESMDTKPPSLTTPTTTCSEPLSRISRLRHPQAIKSKLRFLLQ